MSVVINTVKQHYVSCVFSATAEENKLPSSVMEVEVQDPLSTLISTNNIYEERSQAFKTGNKCVHNLIFEAKHKTCEEVILYEEVNTMHQLQTNRHMFSDLFSSCQND